MGTRKIRKHLIKILILIFFISCHENSINSERIIKIGKDLTQAKFIKTDSTQISDIIFLGNGLKAKIIELQKNSSQFEFQVTKGDLEYPFGNNKSDAILTINTDYKSIGIRLKYDESLDKYHILGWMTIDEN